MFTRNSHRTTVAGPANMALRLFTLTVMLTLAFCADDTFSPTYVNGSFGDFANQDSFVTFSDLPEGTQYKVQDSYSQGILAPLYNMAGNFVKVIQPSDPAFIQDMIKELVKGNTGYITNDIMGTAKNFAGIMACIVIGLLFIILMPIIGFFFCCCRCCGKCGGSRKVTEEHMKNATCYCFVYSVIVLILFIFILTGSLLVYKSSETMASSVDVLANTFTDNIDDMEAFLDNTVTEIEYITSVHYNFTVDVISRDLDNIGYLVGVPVRDELLTSGGIQSVVDSIKALDNSVQTIGTDMLAVNSSINNLTSEASDLSAAISTAKTNLDAALGQAGCHADCGSFDTSGLAMDFDASSMPDISSQVSQINDVMNKNLTELALQSYNEVITIPTRVTNMTKTTVADIKTLLNDFQSTIAQQVSSISDLPSQITSTTGDVKQKISDFQTDLSQYDTYRNIGGLVLASIGLLVGVLQLIGCVCGSLTYRRGRTPTERTCAANSSADFLMASTGFVFIFAWLLMLLTTVMFVVGAPMKRYVCAPLTDPDMTLIKELLDKPGGIFDEYYLGKLILQNGSIPLTFSGMLLGCKANQAAISVMKLDALFDIDAVTDYKSSIDIDSKLDSINVDLSDVKILSAETEQQLGDFRDSVNINFAGFTAELDKNTTQVNLLDFAGAVRILGDQSTGAAQTALYASANELEAIHYDEYNTTAASQDRLKTSLTDLEASVSTVPSVVNTTIDTAKATDNYINTTATSFIVSEAKDFANRILATADQFVNNTKNLIYNEVGRCRPIWNVWNSITNVMLCQQVVDSLGGCWFSLGWIIFFMTLSTIFNVKLAKYFRKMKYVEGDMEYMNDSIPRNKVAHYDL